MTFIPWPQPCNDHMRNIWFLWMLANLEYMVWKENWPKQGYEFENGEDALMFRMRFGL